MNFRKFSLLLLFFAPCSFLFAQTSTQVMVKDSKTDEPLAGVSLYDTRGQLLGKTNDGGITNITVNGFPVFLEKNGYFTQYAYSVEKLHPAYLRKMGGEIPTVTISTKKANESLLILRNKNLPYFYEKDTTLFYKFQYSLTLPDMDWSESASGYIAVNFRGFGAAPSSFDVYRYAYFVQFNYENEDENKILPPSKIMPVVLMFGNDLMSGYGYPLWEKLTHSYLASNQRDWYRQKKKNGDDVFSAYSMDESSRLMEEIMFNKKEKLQKVILYTPEEIHAVGNLRIFNNFSLNNGINSFRTVYTYTKKDSNRLLDSISHLSTFFDKGRNYYQMKFSATLSDTAPVADCKVPVFYLAYNHYHPEQNGYGIWLLLKSHYNIKHDRWLAIQDKNQERIRKEIQKMKEEQEKEQEKAKASKPNTSSGKK